MKHYRLLGILLLLENNHLTRSTLVDRVSWYGKVSNLEERRVVIQSQGVLGGDDG